MGQTECSAGTGGSLLSPLSECLLGAPSSDPLGPHNWESKETTSAWAGAEEVSEGSPVHPNEVGTLRSL